MQVHVIHNDAELEEYTRALFDLTAKDEPSEADAQMIELLDVLIEKYEGEHFPVPSASPLEVLHYLMDRNGLKHGDLVPQIGSLPLISLILAGKRNLTVAHIRALAERFRVPVGVFIGPETPPARVRRKAKSAVAGKRRPVAA